MITSSNTDAERVKIRINDNGDVKGTFMVKSLILNPGKYLSYFAVLDGKEILYRNFIAEIQIKEMPVYFGVITLKNEWQFN